MLKPFNSRERLLLIANILNRTDPATPLVKDAASNTVHGEHHDAEVWELRRSDWLLQFPKRDGVLLTSTEFEFMLIMTKEPFGSFVNRNDILDYQQNEYGCQAFESMVYRLQHKIDAIGELMHMKNYRGIGYSLSLSIISK